MGSRSDEGFPNSYGKTHERGNRQLTKSCYPEKVLFLKLLRIPVFFLILLQKFLMLESRFSSSQCSFYPNFMPDSTEQIRTPANSQRRIPYSTAILTATLTAKPAITCDFERTKANNTYLLTSIESSSEARL